jgi:SagB-type dehydrogenase family enzyme
MTRRGAEAATLRPQDERATPVVAGARSAPSIAPLPAPGPDGLPTAADAFERLLAARRSDRSIGPAPVSMNLLLRLLWAAQGITDPEGRRTAPSAGGRHPLEVLLVTPTGVHRYHPETREIELTRPADRRGQLAGAALSQDVIGRAPATIVITAVNARTESRFGSTRGPRYVLMEAGHVCQNVLLEAVALGLAAVPIGSFDDRRCQLALGLSHDERPLYLIPIGQAAPADPVSPG